MSDYALTTGYRGREPISFGCVLLSFVFFAALSQFMFSYLPEGISQFFRPLIVAILIIQMEKGKIALHEPVHTLSLTLALYCGFALLLHAIDMEVLKDAAGKIMFLLMLYTATKVRWNKREISFILFSTFFGCFVCAAILLACNPITDFSAASGHLKFLTRSVNRNLNAYAFSLGTVLGFIYMAKGTRIPKFIVACCTAVIGYAMLYSQCRGAFFSAVGAITILSFGWIQRMKKYGKEKYLFWIFAIILFYVATYLILKNSALNRLIDGDSKSGRDTLIEEAWQLFLNSDLFGKIFGNGYLYETRTTGKLPAHFAYTMFLLPTGIIGAGLLASIFISTARRLRGYVPYAIFLLAFARTLFEPLDYYGYIPLIISIIISHYLVETGKNSSVLFCRY